MEAGDDRNIFLSTLPATARDRKIAFGVVAASAIFFAAALPFSRLQLPAVPAFVASYQSALAICDVITTILLLSQFSLLRSRALLAPQLSRLPDTARPRASTQASTAAYTPQAPRAPPAA